ncbi:hypothetical protein KAU93_04565 [Candidatus Bathyarchaeota archaeon]|nr:hypothetical protein [Candidatus Bathyarchaeota archaeon]MCK4474738.1 hypothetical protein [Candidatus Bathyarchaeota archaeon]
MRCEREVERGTLRRRVGLLSLLKASIEMGKLVRDWRFWCEAIAVKAKERAS